MRKISRTRKAVGVVILSCLLLSIIGGLLLVFSPHFQAKYHWWMLKLFDRNMENAIMLSSLEELSLPYVKSGLKSKEVRLRFAAIKIMEGILSNPSYFNLEDYKGDPKKIAMLQQDKELVLLITKASRYDEDKRVWVLASPILFVIKGPEGLGYWHSLLSDKSAYTRDIATILLATVHEKDVIPHLIDLLEIGILLKDKDRDKLRQLQGDRDLVVLCGPREYIMDNYWASDMAQESLLRLLWTVYGYDRNNPRQTNEESIKKMRAWWQENKDYLYWSTKEERVIIDEEAKVAGILTEEYRKAHPWPKEDKKPDTLPVPVPDSGDGKGKK